MMYSFIIHIYYHSSCLLILIQLWLQYCPFRAQQQGSQLSQPMMQQVAMETGGDAASSQAPPTTPAALRCLPVYPRSWHTIS
jgi:hypothetical protein